MRKKVLLVDDTQTVTALEKIILGNGFDYTEARNGDEAFQRALEVGPDVILMDLNMPGTDGIAGLRLLKAEPRTARIPVVIVSTRSETEAVESCRAIGCEAFVHKPIDRELLRSTVKKILEENAREPELFETLYVALERLHRSLRPVEVVDAIHEVLINLIGSEDFALLLRDEASGRMQPLSAVGAGAQVGELAVDEPAPGHALAAVPLAGSDGGSVGMLVIVGLLKHKQGLEPRDRTLLELMASHAGLALEAAWCRAAGAPALDVARLRQLVKGTP